MVSWSWSSMLNIILTSESCFAHTRRSLSRWNPRLHQIKSHARQPASYQIKRVRQVRYTPRLSEHST